MKLASQIKESASYIEQANKVKPSVSKASIAWQIYHLLSVIVAVVKTLKESQNKAPKEKFNFWKHFVLITRFIPRGKVKAPKSVNPTGNISRSQLEMIIEEAQKAIQDLAKLPREAHFKHPVLGYLQKKKAIHFLEVHTEHHLKIIRDTLKD